MAKRLMDEFKLTTNFITFKPIEIGHRLVEAAHWCGVGVQAFIEAAIRDRLYEVEAAMKEEKDAHPDS